MHGAADSGFVAQAVVVCRIEESDTDVVAFGEHPDGDGRSLQIQRSVSPADEQDRALGWDTYCLVTEAGAVCYGGIERWCVQGQSVVFTLGAQAAATLELERTLTIELASAGELPIVRAALEAIVDRDEPLGTA